MLYTGILYGLQLQPYEAHLSYHMHFYGDFGISGMDFIKVMNVLVRHLEDYNEEEQLQIMHKRKAFYPLAFMPNEDEEENES